MKKVQLKQIERIYKNDGIHAQQTYEFTMLGTISKHDNRCFTEGGDVGNVQVKSSGASICKGYDIHEHIKMDGATSYAYVVNGFSVAYEMSPTEYEQFINEFGYHSHESQKNGGGEKIRLKKESKKMLAWLESLTL